jgi:hypothetical protein
MATTQPIREKELLTALADYFLSQDTLRNYVLFITGIHTALRIGDLLPLKWEDVYNFKQKCVFESIQIVENKTQKIKIIALNIAVVNALTEYLAELTRKSVRPGDYLFASRKGSSAISSTQAYRIIREAGEELGFSERISCHSLRKTFGYHALRNGVELAIIMEIYNHSSISVTMLYVGIRQDEINKVYRELSLITEKPNNDGESESCEEDGVSDETTGEDIRDESVSETNDENICGESESCGEDSDSSQDSEGTDCDAANGKKIWRGYANGKKGKSKRGKYHNRSIHPHSRKCKRKH